MKKIFTFLILTYFIFIQISKVSANHIDNSLIACSHTVKINTPDGTSFCAGTSIRLEAQVTGALGPFTYKWKRFSFEIATTASITVTEPATYTVEVKDKNGCMVSALVYTSTFSSVAPTITSNYNCPQPLSLQWNKTISASANEILSSVLPITDGGYLLAGYTSAGIGGFKTEASKGGTDYWVVKLDATGKKVWDKTFGGNNTDILSSAVATNDGGFLLVGYSDSDKTGNKSEASKGSGDYWIVKINASGAMQWDKTYGGSSSDFPQSVIASNDGGFLIGGYSWSGLSGSKSENSKGSYDIWTIKINASGTKLWDKTYGGDNGDNLLGLLATNDNGFLLVGTSLSSISGDKSEANRGDLDGWVLKINATGAKIWDKTLGGSGYEAFHSAVKHSDGTYLIGGYSDSPAGFDKTENSKGNKDYWLLKLTDSGVKVWDKTYGGSSTDTFRKILNTSDGGFILTGQSNSGVGGTKTENTKGEYDFWLLKVNTDGTKIWDKTIGGNASELFFDVNNTSDGGYVFGGYSYSGISGDKSEASALNNADYWIIKSIDTCDPANVYASSTRTLTATGCAGTVVWSNQAIGSSIVANPTVTTTYTAICKLNNCPSPNSNAIKVIVKPLLPTITATNASICKGSTTSLTASACASGSFVWTDGLKGSTIQVSPVATKKYSVVCIKDGISSDSSVATTINVNTKPVQPKITATNSTICVGTSTTLTSTACTGGELTWTGGAKGNSISVSPTLTKSYKVLCTIQGCKSDSSIATTINVNAKPVQPKITATNSTICAGTSSTLTSTACTGGELTWTGGAKGNSITVSPTTTKSYKVLCTIQGCKSDSSVATTITVNSKPVQPKITATNSTICVGTSTTLTSTACTGGELTWTGGAKGNSITVSPTLTKSYKVLCTIQGCKSDSSVATTINVNAKPVQPKITATNSTICVGTSTTLTSTACTGGELTWTGGAKGNSITVSPTVTKSYKVLCTIQGCKSDSSVATTINVNSKPVQPKITATNSTICVGSSTTLTSTACTGGELTWTGGAKGNSITVSPTVTKSYKVLCNIQGCKSDSSVATTINVNAKPVQPKITATNSTICVGSSTTLTSTACTGGELTWTGGAKGNSITVSPTVTKSYKVLCNIQGCKSDSSNALQVIVTSTPKKPTISSNLVCANPITKQWDKTILANFADYISTTIQTADGGYLMGGTSFSENGYDKSEMYKGGGDYWLIKVNAKGERVWDKTFGGPSSNYLSAVVATNDGGYLIGGFTYSGKGIDKSEDSKGGADIWIIKVNANGNKVWEKSFGGSEEDYLNVITPTADDGFLLSGYSMSGKNGDKSSESKGSGDYWVIKINSSGKKLWDKSYGGNSIDILSSVIPTKDGGYLLGGHSFSDIAAGDKSEPTKGFFDFWIVKINQNGEKLWDKSYGGDKSEIFSSMIPLKDSGFLIGGYSESSNVGDKSQALKGQTDYWVLRLTENGNKVWDKSYGGSLSDNLKSIIPTNDGNFLLGGSSFSSDGDISVPNKGEGDFWIVKIDSAGNKITEKSFGGKGDDYLSVLMLDYEGGLTIAGGSTSAKGFDKSENSMLDDFWLIKATVCDTKSVFSTQKPTLTATSSDGTITWSNGSTGKSISPTPAVTTVYSAIASTSCNSPVSNSMTVIVPEKPSTPTITASNVNICLGTSTTLISSACYGGVISWTGGLTGNYLSVKPSTTKSYKAICMQKGFNSDSSTAIVINVFTKPAQPQITATNSTVCAGTSTTLTSTACTGGELTWTGGAKGNSITVSPTTTKSYKVLCNIQGCKSDSSLATTINVNAKPVQPKITATNSTICAGTSTVLTSTACTGGELTWTGGAKGNSITISPTVTKSYKVLCTIQGCKSDSSLAATIKVNPIPKSPVISSNITCTNSVSIQWNKTFGTNINANYLTLMVPTLDGGYLLGSTSGANEGNDKTENSKGEFDFWIIKINADGTKVWDKTIGGTNSEWLSSIIATTDGGYLLGGYSGSGIGADKSEALKGGADYWIVKVDANGKKVWDKSFGGSSDDLLSAMVTTSDGGYLLGGGSFSMKNDVKSENPKGDFDYWVIKVDAKGNKLWDKTLGATGEDKLTSIVNTSDGGFLLGGTSYSFQNGDKSISTKGKSDYWVIKINATGTKVWDNSFGGTDFEKLSSIINTPDGGYLLAGISFSDVGGNKTAIGKGGRDYWAVKIDANGLKVWDKTFGGVGDEYLNTVIATKDGGFILGGDSDSNIGGDKTENSRGISDYWIVKITDKGTKVFDKTIGGASFDQMKCMLSTKDGGFLLGGASLSWQSGEKTNAGNGGMGYWVVKANTCDPNVLSSSQKPILTASGCDGTVTWSNNVEGNSITVSPTVLTTYTAICTVNGCKSTSSNGIKVSPDVITNQLGSSMYDAARVETTVTTKTEPSNVRVNVFPNPAQNEILIETNSDFESTFQLYNVLGQKVIEKTFIGKTKIEVNHLNREAYYYLIQHQTLRFTGKVVLD